MLMTAVTGIDNGNAGFLIGNDRSTLFGMAHCADIGIAGNDADRVGNTFAFGSGGIDASANLSTLPPRFIIAASKLKRVLVLGS